MKKKDISIIIALWANCFLSVLLISGCKTSKPCFEPKLKDSSVQNYSLPNPNISLIDSLMNLIQPCPEIEPSIPFVEQNDVIKQTNASNKVIYRQLEKPCKDSIRRQVITRNFYLINKDTEKQLNEYKLKDKSTFWHLKRIFVLNFWFFVALALLISITLYIKFK